MTYRSDISMEDGVKGGMFKKSVLDTVIVTQQRRIADLEKQLQRSLEEMGRLRVLRLGARSSGKATHGAAKSTGVVPGTGAAEWNGIRKVRPAGSNRLESVPSASPLLSMAKRANEVMK